MGGGIEGKRTVIEGEKKRGKIKFSNRYILVVNVVSCINSDSYKMTKTMAYMALSTQ